MKRLPFAAAIAAIALATASGAQADNYILKDSTGTNVTFASKVINGITYPWHLMCVFFGGSCVAVNGDSSGNIGVNVQSSALPAGAATATGQATGNASLGSIDTKLSSQATSANQTSANTKLDQIHSDLVAGVAVTGSALPTGASTGAKQDTGNASAASIDGKLTSTNTKLDQIHADLAPAATAAAQATGNASLGSIDTKLTSQATAANQTATQANPGSDATKANAVQGVTGGKPVTTQIVDSSGAVVDVSQNAIVSGAVSITNASAANTLGMQQNPGADGTGNSGAANASNLLTRGYLHAWDPTLSTWSRLKAGAIDGIVVSPYALNNERWTFAGPSGGIESSTGDNPLVGATAGKINCATDFSISYGTLSGVSEVFIKDGSTVKWRERLDTAANRFTRPPGGTPICGSTNTALNWALGANVTGKVYVNAAGFTH